MNRTPHERALVGLRRTSMVARVSGISLVLLGGISLLIAVTQPISAGFFISVAVVINGRIEWRLSRRLLERDSRAPGRLALNQLFLGLEIAVYAAWQATHLRPESVQELLARPLVKTALAAAPPEAVEMLMLTIPDAIRLLYATVGVVAVVGCGATAIYYQRRRRLLVEAAPAAVVSPPALP